MAVKELDIATMKEEILNNPEVYQTTFMVDTSNWNYSRDLINSIKQFIGKDNIKGLQIITKTLMLVTMNNVDDMNDILASLPNSPVSNRPDANRLTVIPVLPVHARVRSKISGIPLPLVLGNLRDIKELFIELVKELKDVMMSLEKEEDIYTGNLIVDALTNDLKVTHEKLKSNVGITYKKFHGAVKFVESFSVREESKWKIYRSL